MAKVSLKQASKSKLKKADSVISLKEPNHEIISQTIIGDTQLKVIFGNIF
jgi:hypothetical protein